jgi:hypothetical protein
MEELKKIIERLSAIRSECEDDLLFSKAVDIYMMREQEKNKDNRTESIGKREAPKIASSKQIFFLKKLGYKGDTQNLSLIEASKIIDEMTKKAKQEDENDEQYQY